MVSTFAVPEGKQKEFEQKVDEFGAKLTKFVKDREKRMLESVG